MQIPREAAMNYYVDAFDSTGNATAFIGTEIFPAVLHSMLDEVEEKGYSHIVSWQPHGRCFVVHNRKEFVRLIMPVYFRMSKFASFQRQLNLYDYKRITAGLDKGGYYHDNFVRGRKGLCQHIVRRQIKGTLTRKPAPATEPDFYRSGMTRCTNTDKMQLLGRQHDITTSTSLSDLMMNARGVQSNTRTYAMPAPPSMFTNILVNKPEFSNTEGNPGAMGRQLHSKMTFADLQGLSTQCLMVAMGAATKFQQFSNGSSVPRFNHATSSETHNPAPGCYNTGNESFVTMPCPPSYATWNEMNAQDCNSGSVVAMLCPSRHSRGDDTTCMLQMNNCAELQFMTNEQPAKAYHADFDNPGYETFSTSFFSGPAMDAPAIDETFDSTASNTFFNECNHFERMPQKAFYQY